MVWVWIEFDSLICKFFNSIYFEFKSKKSYSKPKIFGGLELTQYLFLPYLTPTLFYACYVVILLSYFPLKQTVRDTKFNRLLIQIGY